MDLSDLPKAPSPGTPRVAAVFDLHALVAQLGMEVATTLSIALERVTTLTATGRIDRNDLRSLREEIDRARRAGITGQQLFRLADGRVRLQNERLDLTALLREALLQRGREIEARGHEVGQVLTQAYVLSDATLLFSLLQALLDWSFEHTVSRVDLNLDIKSWPAHARLSSRFRHTPADEVESAVESGAGNHAAELDTMSWRLLQQTAAVLALPLDRRDAGGKTEVILEFPQTLAQQLSEMTTSTPDRPEEVAYDTLALAGRHVVVLAGRREVRNVVREALRPLGLMVDFAATLEEAQALLAEGLPHAVVYEASLGGGRFDKMRNDMLSEVSNLAFIQLAEQGKGFQVLNLGGRQITSVGRDGILESLPAALMFELSRQN
jgi:CheY-like chemotaxis protein